MRGVGDGNWVGVDLVHSHELVEGPGYCVDARRAELLRLLAEAETTFRLGTLYQWVSQRKIPHVRIGRLLKFDLNDIEKWISERKIEPKEY